MEDSVQKTASFKRIEQTVDRLREFVGQGLHHGLIIENVKTVPKSFQLDASKRRVGAWLKSPKPKAPRLPDSLPADYRAFVAKYGSLTWLSPEPAPDEWFYLHNVGSKALVDLRHPDSRFDEYLAAEAMGLEDSLDSLFVFHDGFNRGFAFDGRVRSKASEELLVCPFVEDELERFLAKPPRPVGTFAEWFVSTIERLMAELAGRAAPVKRSALVEIPPDQKVPTGAAITASQEVLGAQLKTGWPLLAKGSFAAVAKSARALIAKEPLYLYAYSQLLDALAHDSSAQAERVTIAWQLLALARRGIEGIHEDYAVLYRQKAATVLASLALSSSMVTVEQAKRLIAEAQGPPAGPDDQMVMTGTWDSKAIKKQLDAAALKG